MYCVQVYILQYIENMLVVHSDIHMLIDSFGIGFAWIRFFCFVLCVPLCVCCHQRLMNVIVRHVEVAFQLNALVTNISTCNRQFGVCMCCLFILCNCTLFYTFSLQTDSMKCDAMLFNRRTLYSTN